MPIRRPNAPRFHALWMRRAGRPIFAMSREVWNQIRVEQRPVLIDARVVSEFPFAEVASSESFIAAVAEREDEARVRLSVYRNDQSDPQPINVDRYVVLERFPADLDVWGLIQNATTDPGPNFIRYRDDHVFLVKEHPGDDHWLDTLPVGVTALLER